MKRTFEVVRPALHLLYLPNITSYIQAFQS